MINSMWVLLTIVVSIILLIVIIININQGVKFSKRYRDNSKKTIAESRTEVKTEIEKPGKIIVSDSTYEVLMEEKKKQR